MIFVFQLYVREWKRFQSAVFGCVWFPQNVNFRKTQGGYREEKRVPAFIIQEVI